MIDAPPTPALALVIDALREFGIKCASELNVTGTVLRFADEKAEAAAKDLLAKLAQTNDAVYQRGYAEGWKHAVDESPNLHKKEVDETEDSHKPPPDAIRAAEVVAWARNTQGGLQVCYMQKEPPRDAPWDRDSGESWTPLYTAPPSGAALRQDIDAERYRWLRARDLDTIQNGGVFAGLTPNNVVLNGEDLDAAIDEARRQEGA